MNCIRKKFFVYFNSAFIIIAFIIIAELISEIFLISFEPNKWKWKKKKKKSECPMLVWIDVNNFYLFFSSK